jgi:hypothetical protein
VSRSSYFDRDDVYLFANKTSGVEREEAGHGFRVCMAAGEVLACAGYNDA